MRKSTLSQEHCLAQGCLPPSRSPPETLLVLQHQNKIGKICFLSVSKRFLNIVIKNHHGEVDLTVIIVFVSTRKTISKRCEINGDKNTLIKHLTFEVVVVVATQYMRSLIFTRKLPVEFVFTSRCKTFIFWSSC